MLHHDPTTQALAVRGLCKAFDGAVAVNDIDLDIPRGSIYGIVGPNGAGKTTMISMAAGLLRPDRGDTWVAGYHTWEQPLEMKRAMGLLADGVPVFDRLSAPELLSYVGGLRGMPWWRSAAGSCWQPWAWRRPGTSGWWTTPRA